MYNAISIATIRKLKTVYNVYIHFSSPNDYFDSMENTKLIKSDMLNVQRTPNIRKLVMRTF